MPKPNPRFTKPPRSKSAGPVPVIDTRRKHHASMGELLTAEDKATLGLNKYEEAFTLAELQDKIKRQAD
jgi:hypothetical protein